MMRLLHGTSERDWLIIQQSGGLRNPYLTTLETVAWFFAEESADNARSRPIILEVTVDDTSKLEADLPMFQEPIFEAVEEMGYPSVYAYHQAVKEGNVPWPRNRKDWETSLEVMKSVRYWGLIPPGKIRIYERLP
jgi:hypothetical protein